MILKSGCAFKQYSPEETLVLTTSRLTKNDGVTPDPDLEQVAVWNHWITGLAPNPKAVGAWYRGEISWKEFTRLYREHLSTNAGVAATNFLYQLVKERGPVTVLCVEDTPEHCHRSILLDYMKEKYPEIEVVYE